MNMQTLDLPTTRIGDDDDETALVKGLRQGDAHAFETILRLHGPRMLAVARRLLRCEQNAADAVQEAFICAFRKGATFEGQSRLSTWLHRITVNSCLMQRRSTARRHEVNVDDLVPTFDESGHHTRPIETWEPVSHAVDAETRACVRSCIDRLPDDYRTVLILRDIEEYDTDEAARILGCSEGCVKTRLHRARTALRTLLEQTLCKS